MFYNTNNEEKASQKIECFPVFVFLSVKYPHHSEQLINELFQAQLMAAKVIARDHYL